MILEQNIEYIWISFSLMDQKLQFFYVYKLVKTKKKKLTLDIKGIFFGNNPPYFFLIAFSYSNPNSEEYREGS